MKELDTLSVVAYRLLVLYMLAYILRAVGYIEEISVFGHTTIWITSCIPFVTELFRKK